MVDRKLNIKPQISVIICCYGGEKTIKACLNSLLNQDLDNSSFEVIIVDDGSKDNSAEIINNFIKARLIHDHPNFKYFRKKNEGLSIARNFGLYKSLAELVVYIDEDAIANNNYLTTIVEYFKNNINVNCLGGEIDLYNDENEFASLIQDSVFSLHMKNKNSIIGTNMAFRKSFLVLVGGFQPEFTYRGDETALFSKSRGHIIKGRSKQMRVKHMQPANAKAWLKTRYENGYFSIAIDFLMKKKTKQIFINLIKSLLVVIIPYLFISSFFFLYYSLVIFITIIFFCFLIIYRKLFFNNLIKNTLKEFSINRNGKTEFREIIMIIYLIFMGLYKSEIGYLKGYLNFKKINFK